MTRPGDRLRAIATRWCGDATMTRLIDPLLADLQSEYAEALALGRVWSARRIHLNGVLAFARVMTLHAAARVLEHPREWSATDRSAVARVLMGGVATTVVVTVALTWSPIADQYAAAPDLPLSIIATLIPQALGVSMPIGMALSLLTALGGTESVRVRRALLATAMLVSTLSFANVLWITPAANQGFRVAIWERLGGRAAGQPDFRKGRAEMTIGELVAYWDQQRRSGLTTAARGTAFAWQQRVSLAAAPFALTMLAFSRRIRRPASAWRRVATATGAVVGYYAIMIFATLAGRSDVVPTMIAAWIPNVACAFLAGALMVSGRMERRALARH